MNENNYKNVLKKIENACIKAGRDRSEVKLIAVSNGQKSGTQNTIWYARKQNVLVTAIRA